MKIRNLERNFESRILLKNAENSEDCLKFTEPSPVLKFSGMIFTAFLPRSANIKPEGVILEAGRGPHGII